MWTRLRWLRKLVKLPIAWICHHNWVMFIMYSMCSCSRSTNETRLTCYPIQRFHSRQTLLHPSFSVKLLYCILWLLDTLYVFCINKESKCFGNCYYLDNFGKCIALLSTWIILSNNVKFVYDLDKWNVKAKIFLIKRKWIYLSHI